MGLINVNSLFNIIVVCVLCFNIIAKMYEVVIEQIVIRNKFRNFQIVYIVKRVFLYAFRLSSRFRRIPRKIG
jgi:hypothetical protein